jgi:hypothetical protein
MPTLFRKTAKGQTEIETRAHRLTPRLRGLLILVDGKRDRAALAAMVPQQLEELLQELSTQGFIEAFEGAKSSAPASPPPPPPASPPPPPPAALSPQAEFEKLRRDAVRALNDALGPAAETVAMRIEKARSMEELRPLLGQAAQAMNSMRGRAAAEAFAQKFSAE